MPGSPLQGALALAHATERMQVHIAGRQELLQFGWRELFALIKADAAPELRRNELQNVGEQMLGLGRVGLELALRGRVPLDCKLGLEDNGLAQAHGACEGARAHPQAVLGQILLRAECDHQVSRFRSANSGKGAGRADDLVGDGF
eukprot:2186213-Alexandrium_andersonii.AAC.1